MVHRVESPCTHFIFAHFAHLKFDGDHSYKYVFSLQTKMHINIITASASQHMSLPTIRFFLRGRGGGWQCHCSALPEVIQVIYLETSLVPVFFPLAHNWFQPQLQQTVLHQLRPPSSDQLKHLPFLFSFLPQKGSYVWPPNPGSGNDSRRLFTLFRRSKKNWAPTAHSHNLDHLP